MNTLTEMRQKRGMSQRKLAAAADIKQPNIAAFERKMPEGITVATIAKLAAALGCDAMISNGKLFFLEKN